MAMVVLVVVLLLPWGRHHDYLRDLYDYGLVVSANGRMAAGERPYVDFTTPIQAGFLAMNLAAEKLGGNTFVGLTYGAAALIVFMQTGLTWLLARRWPLPLAAAAAAAVTCGSAVQHTIIWHNVVGVAALAGIAWSGALAPVLRRVDWRLNLILLTALFLGGVNKLNFHLIGLAIALGWILRAGFAGRTDGKRALMTVAAVLVCGAILPVLAEMAWTGATFTTWWYNVVQLPVASRASALPAIMEGRFYFKAHHDYYGPLLLPPAALVVVLLMVAALVLAIRWGTGRDSGSERVFIFAAGFFAVVGSLALLATNNEIDYVAVSAALVLAVAIILGFDVRIGSRSGVAAVLVPVLVLAIAAWVSAWRGQRSQFGHSSAARASYVSAEKAGAAFFYLRGLHLPPEVVESLEALGQWGLPPDGHGLRPVFYGPGMEWAERVLPAVKVAGRPLWAHWGTSYGRVEEERLIHDLSTGNRYNVVLCALAWDSWNHDMRFTFDQFYTRDLLGPVIVRRSRKPSYGIMPGDSINFLDHFGGNVAPTALMNGEPPLSFAHFEADGLLLGLIADEGGMQLSAPTYRAGGKAVLRRLDPAGRDALHADFKVIVQGAIPERIAWSAQVELPQGQDSIEVPFQMDGAGRPLSLRVHVDERSAYHVAAGFRELRITHAIEQEGVPPALRSGMLAETPPDPMTAGALFGQMDWLPQRIVVRGGRVVPDGLELSPGGEVWFHRENMLVDVVGAIRERPGGNGKGHPTIRVVWYKGGRLDLLQQASMPDDGSPLDFHAWCGEPGGWIGILVDAQSVVPPVLVRMRKVETHS